MRAVFAKSRQQKGSGTFVCLGVLLSCRTNMTCALKAALLPEGNVCSNEQGSSILPCTYLALNEQL